MIIEWEEEGPVYLTHCVDGAQKVLGRCSEAKKFRVDPFQDAEFLYCPRFRLTQLGTLTWVHAGLAKLMSADIVWQGTSSTWSPVAFDPLLLSEGEPVLSHLLLLRANGNHELTIPKLLKIRSMLIFP